MWLTDLISGKPEQRRFVDPVIGELTAQVRPRREAKWHSWRGRCVLPGQTRPTTFLLCGDGRAPSRWLLEEVHRVLQGLADLKAKASELLAARPDLGPPESFVLTSVSTWEEVDDQLLLEFVRQPPLGPGAAVEFEWSVPGPGALHQVRLRPN
jgi:hypothetical protein